MVQQYGMGAGKQDNESAVEVCSIMLCPDLFLKCRGCRL